VVPTRHLYGEGRRLDRDLADPCATAATIGEQHLAILRKRTGPQAADVDASGHDPPRIVTPVPVDLVPAGSKIAIGKGADSLAGSIVPSRAATASSSPSCMYSRFLEQSHDLQCLRNRLRSTAERQLSSRLL
jgi:hypothetical protein